MSSPQLRIPASPAGHVHPAPPVRAPPPGRSRPAPGHLARAAAAGCESAVWVFSPWLARAPPLPFLGSSRRLTRSVLFSSRAGRVRTLGISGRETAHSGHTLSRTSWLVTAEPTGSKRWEDWRKPL